MVAALIKTSGRVKAPHARTVRLPVVPQVSSSIGVVEQETGRLGDPVRVEIGSHDPEARRLAVGRVAAEVQHPIERWSPLWWLCHHLAIGWERRLRERWTTANISFGRALPAGGSNRTGEGDRAVAFSQGVTEP